MLLLLRRKLRSELPNFDKPELFTFLNPYSYLIARSNKELLNEFDSIYIDGKALCLFLSRTGLAVERRSFDMTSLAPYVFDECIKKNLSIYLIGGEPGIANKAKEIFISHYPKLNIVGISSGFFQSEKDRDETLNDIRTKNPAIVISGMGTPAQEHFLIELRNRGWQGIGFTCGGFFHQTVKGGIDYYPRIINKLNLRWLYRIYDEPKLIRRYFLYYPLFSLKFLKDSLTRESDNRKT